MLGGYATGTLTGEERRALFETALEDQQLFDALAQEQPLRDLLRDPAVKAQLLAALGEAPATWRQRAARWMWGHAVGLAAVACFVTLCGYMARQVHFTPPRVVVVATQPNRVDVNGSLPPEPARPRRIFDLESVNKAAAHPPAMLMPPPFKPTQGPAPPFERAFVVGRPEIPRPLAATALVRAGPLAAGQLGQARGGRGGGGGGPVGVGGVLPAEQAAGGAMSAMAVRPNMAAPAPAPLPQAQADASSAPAAKVTAKIDPALLALVQRMRTGETNVRITLTDAPADSLEQLRKAGFTVAGQEGNELTGHIAVEKLDAVAQLAFVVHIASQ
jgi:hypothetical protein